MKNTITILTFLICSIAFGQTHTKRVLFLGNSYTSVNNLPQMIANVATSMGDTLIFDSNIPGGYTFQGHSSNTVSLDKIAAGNWDYVVLQEQSQLPSFPIEQVETDVFPYAHILDSIINADNPCVETVFYMTWGRKNGDTSNCASWPPVCTYQGMDSLLNLRYRMMADRNNAILSPAGAVWHYIRQNFPLIDLYQADESHPSVAGTYATACCFYTTLFRKDPTLVTYNPTLPAIDAVNIRAAARLIVYDSLMNWHIGEYDPKADFTYLVTGTSQITFTNNSKNAVTFTWDFGDGDGSSVVNPVHTYSASDSYTVKLIAAKCGVQDTIVQTINISPTRIFNSPEYPYHLWRIFPNPITSAINLTPNIPGNLTFKIFNMTGGEIQNGTMNNSARQIAVSSLADGLYLLQLFNNNKTLGQQRFIKISN
jgi:hypothetical protein